MIELTFNGVNPSSKLGEGNFVINDIKGRGPVPREATISETPGMDGGYLQHVKTPPRILELKITVKSADINDLRTKVDDLNGLLVTNEDATIEFSDEDRIYYGVLADGVDWGEIRSFGQGTIRFVCADPYRYGPQMEESFVDGQASFFNPGTAGALPVIELTAQEDLTFIQVADDAEQTNYNMIGRRQSVEDTVVDTRPARLITEMGDLTQWSTTGTVRPDGATIAGSFVSDGQTVYASDYGSAAGWHGPVLRADLPNPINDYFVEAFFSLKASDVSQVGRVELYLIGDDGTAIGKLAIKDLFLHATNNEGEVRVGSLESGVMLVFSHGYREGSYNNFYGRLTLTKHGNRFHGQVGEIINGKGYNRANGEYDDGKGEYQTPLAAIQIHTAASGTHDPVNEAKIHHVRVSEIIDENANEVPIVTYNGETTAFDHKDSEIRIDGVSKTDLKNFGGSYFPLKHGTNNLYTFASGTLGGVVRYRPRYY